MKRIRMTPEGLSCIQTELRQMRGTIDAQQRQPRRQVHRQQQKQQPVETSQFSSQRSSSTTIRHRTHRNQGMVPQNNQRKEGKTKIQNLADIILQQAHRIEKQQRELQCLKLHYERQVSTIKSNAEMLEQQLERLQGSVNQTKAQKLGKNYHEIFSALEKLQKHGLDPSQTQSITNHLLTQLLPSKPYQKK